LIISILSNCSCNRQRHLNNIYDSSNFSRTSNNADSAKNMYVIYKSTIQDSLYLYRFYWDNGVIMEISYFKNGIKDGPWSTYFDNGKISFDGMFLNGQKQGIHNIYFRDGGKSAIEKYDKGMKVDLWYYYNPDGSILKTEDYKKSN
jgi:antitoxin component YwqK of YwqJK toxin-antitoxin module